MNKYKLNKLNYKFKFYKKAQQIQTIIGQKFDCRFDEIRNSFFQKSILLKIYDLIFYKVKHSIKCYLSNQNLNLQKIAYSLIHSLKTDFSCQKNKIKYIWLGHSSSFLSIGGQINILIDPIFSERCSPSKYLGPKRHLKSTFSVIQLPKIDIVLVSHDHFDHLDQESLIQLQQKYKPTFFTGLNSRQLLPKNSKVYELNWTQTKNIIVNNKQLQITFIPACHWSRRGLFDFAKRLWGGFVLKTYNGKLIYYAGDTGYCGLFKELSYVYECFDLCLLPIGVYKPQQRLKNQHLNPQEAIIVHKQIKSKKSIGIHWGTFPLSQQQVMEPKEELERMRERHEVNRDEFAVIKQGEPMEIDLYLVNQAENKG